MSRDWNGDGLFDQADIVAALQTGSYRSRPYALRFIDSVFAGRSNSMFHQHHD